MPLTVSKRGAVFVRTQKQREALRRKARALKFRAQGRNEQVRPLTIAPKSQWPALLKKGVMAFRKGNERIVLPLLFEFGESLQGVYAHPNGTIYVFRHQSKYHPTELEVNHLVRTKNGTYEERRLGDRFVTREDNAHMMLNTTLQGHGLGLKGAHKAERHVRAQKGGEHTIYTTRFVTLYTKLGYREVQREFEGDLTELHKKGPLTPKANMHKYHSIEAINPKTGKVEIFYFPLKH